MFTSPWKFAVCCRFCLELKQNLSSTRKFATFQYWLVPIFAELGTFCSISKSLQLKTLFQFCELQTGENFFAENLRW